MQVIWMESNGSRTLDHVFGLADISRRVVLRHLMVPSLAADEYFEPSPSGCGSGLHAFSHEIRQQSEL